MSENMKLTLFAIIIIILGNGVANYVAWWNRSNNGTTIFI